MSQSNTQAGQIVLNSSEDLQDKEGYLVKIIDTSNVAEFALPDAETDLALFIITDGGDEDEDTAERDWSSDVCSSDLLSGTCVPGDVLVLATPNGTVDGMVKALPADSGTYRGIAIAEEVGADGQLVKARPAMIGYITVT